jgi:dynein heavy chain, axonemal
LANDVLTKSKEDISIPPQLGVYIYGLFLEGASWSRQHGRLAESKAKVLFDYMPIMHIYAINSNEQSTQSSTQKALYYVCPIYKKPKRTDRTFIATVNLRTNVPPETWILRGTCLLCDIK